MASGQISKSPCRWHVQLGLLYANTGDTSNAFSQYASGKSRFPESSPYVDYLMSKKTRSGTVKSRLP